MKKLISTDNFIKTFCNTNNIGIAYKNVSDLVRCDESLVRITVKVQDKEFYVVFNNIDDMARVIRSDSRLYGKYTYITKCRMKHFEKIVNSKRFDTKRILNIVAGIYYDEDEEHSNKYASAFREYRDSVNDVANLIREIGVYLVVEHGDKARKVLDDKYIHQITHKARKDTDKNILVVGNNINSSWILALEDTSLGNWYDDIPSATYNINILRKFVETSDLKKFDNYIISRKRAENKMDSMDRAWLEIESPVVEKAAIRFIREVIMKIIPTIKLDD